MTILSCGKDLPKFKEDLYVLWKTYWNGVG